MACAAIQEAQTPGGWEIEFQELEKAKERAEKAGLLTPAPAGEFPSAAYSFQVVADEDPNLALAGLRIEIERRLVQFAEADGVDRPRKSAGLLLRLLADRQLISQEQTSVLSDLLALLNQAVHGATVPKAAAEWAIQVGPKLLRTLDERISERRRDA